MKKKFLMTALAVTVVMALVGCGKQKETTEATTEATTTQEETTEDNSHEGMTYNELTGEWSADYVSRRPVAVMINNLKEALPSSGTKQADIIYECMVEGGITRLMAIFSDYDSIEKIGSVRSARHYYINIANEYDAIYVHYGQSKPAKSLLDDHAIDNINGLTYDAGFYRDTDRVAPHNAYTTGERIVKGIEDFGYDSDYDTNHEAVLSFREEDETPADGQDASTVRISFSNYSKPYFEYNTETGLYDRYEYDAPQIDNLADTDDQILNFKNVIIQISTYACINTENDLQELTQVGEGDGYYCTDGKQIPIKWEKGSANGKTKYYTQDGEELQLNPGKTWISIVGSGDNCGVSFE